MKHLVTTQIFITPLPYSVFSWIEGQTFLYNYCIARIFLLDMKDESFAFTGLVFHFINMDFYF